MRKFQYKTAYVILSFFLALSLSSCKEEQQQTPAQAQQRAIEVEVITLATSRVSLETDLPGRTNAYRVAEVRPQVNGIIKKREFVEGSEVQAGQLLYQIDPASYQAQYDSAKASLARAEASEHSAKLRAERYDTLVKTKAVSELDQIENEANWKQAMADVAAAKAALNTAKINLDYTRITAPISGIIGKSLITEGALVTAQQSTPLAIIQDLDPIYVDMTQSSADLTRLKREFVQLSKKNPDEFNKSEVSIILEDGSEYPYKGSLEFSDVTVDQSTGAVTLRTIIENPSQDLLPGMFVRAKLSNGFQDTIVIPTASISRNQKGEPMVMVVNQESKVETRMIQTGRNTENGIIVQTGLNPGDKLITAGLQNIRPGATVTAVEKAQAENSQGEK